MTLRLRMWTAVAFLAALSGYGAQSVDVNRATEALEDDLKQFVALRDAIAGQFPEPANPSATGLALLTAASALEDCDLTIHLLRKDGAWTAAWATSPAWSPHSHYVAASHVTWDGGQFNARLRLHLLYWRDRHVLHHGMGSPCVQPFGTYFNAWPSADGETLVRDGRPIAVDCVLVCREQSGALKGVLRVERPASSHLKSGDIPIEGRWHPAGRPAFAPFPKIALSLADSTWKFPDTVADRAVQVYEQIRALEVQRRLGLPAHLALGQITRARLTHQDPMAGADPAKGKVKVRRRGDSPARPKGPSLDEGGTLDEALDDAGRDPKKEEQDRQEAAARLATALARLDAMRAHIQALRETVERWRTADAPADVARGDQDPGDPEFGPWGDPVPLAETRERASVLPSAPPNAAVQEWRFVNTWRVLGPFPIPAFACPSPALPDLVPAFGSLLVVDQAGFPWRHVSAHTYYGDGTSAWRTMTVHPHSGVLTPPIYTKGKYPYFGIDYGAFYAVTELQAEDACQPWAALAFKDQAMVWANDRLVWRSDVNGPTRATPMSNVCRFPLPLRKGLNRIAVRVDGYARPSWMAMSVCVSGQPRPVADVAQTDARRAERLKEAGAPRQNTLGLSGDGSASFPGVDPPLAWDLDAGSNILWRTDLPESYGGVVLAGDRVFTPQAPFALCSLDKHTGKRLWRRNADPFEVYAPKPAAEKARALVAEIDSLDDLPAPSDAEAERRKKLVGELNALYADQQSWPQEKRIRLSFNREAGLPGPTLPTPVTDGKRVWMKVGAEALACFDLDGNRLWFKRIEHVGGQMGATTTSPILVGDRLYLSVPRYELGGEKVATGGDDEESAAVEGAYVDHRAGRRYAIACYDAATGERLWITPGIEGVHFGNRYDADGIPSPVPVRLSDGRATMDVVVLPGAGAVIRADDGAVLMKRFGPCSMCPPPLADANGSLWIVDDGLAAVRLFMQDRDRIGARFLFHAGLPARVSTYCGVVRHGGRLYFADGSGMGYLLGFDEATGDQVFNRPLVFGRQSSGIYMPPVVAGDVLFVADHGLNDYNRFWSWKNGSLPPAERRPLLPGAMSAVAVGREPVVLARNSIPGIVSTPVYEGRRMYIRSSPTLFCIGKDDAASRRYAAEKVAHTVLPQIPPAPPNADPDPVSPPMLEPSPSDYAPEDLAPEQLMTGWSVLGPFAGDGAAAAAEFGHPRTPRIFPNGKGGATAAGVEGKLESVARSRLNDWPSDVLVDELGAEPLYDLARLHKRQPRTVCLWSTILRSDRDWTLRLDLGGFAGARLWIGGVEVKDGARVRFRRGCYTLAMRTEAGELAALPRAFRPTWWPAASADEEKALRRARIVTVEPWLKRAASEAGNTPAGQRCATLLEWLKSGG